MPQEGWGCLSMKSHMMFLGGKPSVQLLLHQAQPRHRTALCEVTKLLPPRVTGDQDMQGPAGIPWGFRRGPETLGKESGCGGRRVCWRPGDGGSFSGLGHCQEVKAAGAGPVPPDPGGRGRGRSSHCRWARGKVLVVERSDPRPRTRSPPRRDPPAMVHLLTLPPASSANPTARSPEGLLVGRGL